MPHPSRIKDFEIAVVAEAPRIHALVGDVTKAEDCARAAAPQIVRQGWGRIVNISMSHETMQREGFSPYGQWHLLRRGGGGKLLQVVEGERGRLASG